MSHFDQWDWYRLVLAVAIVVCNFFIWRGVSLEESEYKFDKELGKKWLIRGLAWEFFFAMVLIVVETTGSIRQKYEIADITLRAGTLERQAALLRLQLAEQLPRFLFDDQKASLISDLQSSPKGRVCFMAAPKNDDGGFSDSIREIFIAAGFTDVPWLAGMAVSMPPGISLSINSDVPDPAETGSILRAFAKIDMPLTPNRCPQTDKTCPVNFCGVGTIAIAVGAKPPPTSK